jgi:polysaccharide export outer membrane protein
MERSMKFKLRMILSILFVCLFSGVSFSQQMLNMDFNDDPFSETYGMKKQKTKEQPVEPETKETVIVSDEYLVGVDDVLDINVIKPETIQSTVTVAPDGTITFPYIGNVTVKGLTLPKIQEVVQLRLANGFVEFPIVSVSLRQTRSKKFTIYGQVNKPGGYPVEEGMSILRAITDAGGFIVPGSTGRVKILRPKPNSKETEVIEYDVAAILNGADQNVRVLSGDTVVVSVDKFFIYGQVLHPGAYSVEENMTILHAVTLAGGFIESGSTGKVKLFRPKTKDREAKIIESDINAILKGTNQNSVVFAGDTIVVTLDKFFISGQVNRPGAYPVEDNMTLLSAVTQAGGFVESGKTGKIKLIRPKIGSKDSEIKESDISSVLTGGAQNIAVRAGDSIVVSTDKFFISGQVNRPGAYSVEDNMTLLSAVTQAGGFAEASSTGKVKLIRPKIGSKESEITESNIEAILDGSAQNMAVRPGDSIVVSSDKFFVYGEVVRPGVFPLEARTNTLTAISMAGGFTKFGSANRVKVLRVNPVTGAYDQIKVNINEVMAGDTTTDVQIKPRDIVVVSEGMF